MVTETVAAAVDAASDAAPTLRPVRLGLVRDVAVMEAQYDGSFIESGFTGYEWLDPTPGCRLVWTRKWHAESCAARGHRNRFYQYYYRQVVIEGNVTLIEERYERRALRRDGPRPSPVAVPVTAPEAPATPPEAPAATVTPTPKPRLRRAKAKAPAAPAEPVASEPTSSHVSDSLATQAPAEVAAF